MDLPEVELRQLRAFTVVAEEAHVGRAAARLGIAQPPLSQQIQRLETKVGHALFTRHPHGMALTPAGEELLETAKSALRLVAQGLDAARRIGRGEAGRLRVGMAASLAASFLPGLVRTFRALHPGVVLDIREMTTDPQATALRDGLIDVGIGRDATPSEGVAVRTVAEEPLVAVLPKAHRLARNPDLNPRDLAAETFALFPSSAGAAFHDRILDVCRTAGFTPTVGYEAVEWSTLVAFVAAELAVTIAPKSVPLAGAVRRALPPEALTAVTLARREDDANPLVAAFLDAALTSRSARTTPPAHIRVAPRSSG